MKNGITIYAHFAEDGRCDYIFFTAYELLTKRKFTPEERDDLLKANNLGKILSKREKSKTGTILWESADGEVAAMMTGNESRILFTMKDGWTTREASLKQGSGLQPRPHSPLCATSLVLEISLHRTGSRSPTLTQHPNALPSSWRLSTVDSERHVKRSH